MGLSFTQIEGVNIQVRNTMIILNNTVFNIHIVLRDAHTTIKKECIYAEMNVGYKDFQTCYNSIFKYIEGFYNSRRRHSKLNYICPNEFEKQNA